jgi:TolB-like protein
MHMTRVSVAAVVAGLVFASSASAQCPDGSPPPCRGSAGAAAVRRPNPPLDDRTWIVVPFENVARVPDIDWLKDASVNLLYLDMSKWRDIRVIDDERVADFIREVPEARGGQSLTLQSGIAVARRAGAGKLVMGDLLKIGNRTQVVAKVFDVRTGQRMRTVRQESNNPDSIMGIFGLLARAVLNVEPPTGTSLGTIGTTSVGAYQAYLAGVAALNRWNLDSANLQFTQALALDSTFALAHYKLAVVLGWQSAGSAGGPTHAAAAVRLGGSLPPRERNLVAGYDAFERQRYADACTIFGHMVQADSTDVEAWYELGECSYHDPVVVAVGGDSTHLAFRSSWNTMLRAFRRTLDLDPTYHLAFQHIQDALLSGNRSGCLLRGTAETCSPQNSGVQGTLRRSGDSLLTEPVNSAVNPQAVMAQQLDAVRQHARRQNLEDARRGALAWLAAGPTESRPRMAYARILLRLGEPGRADSVARLVTNLSRGSRTETGNFMADRIEIALKIDNWAEANRLADSLRAFTDSIAGARNLGLLMHAVLGHSRDLDAGAATIQGPDWVKRYFQLEGRAFMGAPADSVIDAEAEFARNAIPSAGVARTATTIAGTLVWYDPRLRGNRWPASDTASGDPRLKLMSMLATGDTARFRVALARYDSIGGTLTEEPDAGLALPGAYAHLAVGDTAGALVWLRRFRDQTWNRSAVLDQIAPGFGFQGLLWARTFQLMGDLTAATGQRDEARQAYRRLIGMWEHGDPDVQPAVARAREALSHLGG